MRQFHVRHALAVTLNEGFVLARGKRLFPTGLSERKQARAHLRFRSAFLSDRAPVCVSHLEEAVKKFRGLGAAPDGQEIDDLDEQPRLAAARPPHGLDETAQAFDIAVVADAQQRSARHVANAGRFDDDRARPTARQPLIPGDDGVGDKAGISRAPRHHRGNPGALGEAEPALLERREQARAFGFLARRNSAGLGGVADALGRTPHGRV